MNVFETIEKALNSGVLIRDLTYVPSAAATPEALVALESLVGRPLSSSHLSILRRWNGANLDIIRICGTGAVEESLPTVEEDMWLVAELGLSGAVPVANDYNGYTYFELEDGSIIRWDHDGDGHAIVGADLNDFIQNSIFGTRSAEFYGAEWLQELRSAGVVGAEA